MITDIMEIDDKTLYQVQVLIHNQQVVSGISPGSWIKSIHLANDGVEGFEIRAVRLGVE